jgi:hypothetical protein
MNNVVLDDANGFGGIFENWGTINYTGAVGTTTYINMALLNHGTMNLSGDGTGGTLRFGSTRDVPNDRFGFVMDQGNINLSQGISVQANATGYHQTGGTLNLMDNTLVGFWTQTQNRGTTFDGGVFRFTSVTGYGRIIYFGTVNWNAGTLNMRVDGTNGNNHDTIASDQFNVAGGANGPTLNVTVQGTLRASTVWSLITGAGISRFPHEILNGLLAEIRNNRRYQK